jgi:iron(III) transport system substrate-binding protein
MLELETSRGAMARPMFGTTLTHFTVLHRMWGPQKLQEWRHDMRRRGLREVTGNAVVKDVVASGQCDFGWTDSDDVFVALDDGAEVDLAPIRVAGQTIAIPNTAAIIKGTRRLSAAQQLVDFLASADTELRLARSRARQIPLGGVDESQIPREVLRLRHWAADGIDLRNLLEDRRAVLAWLKSEYAP